MSKITYIVKDDPFIGSDGLYHYLYKIVNNINNHEYIGMHSTKNLDDGYKGSGYLLKQAYKAYGIHSFIKIILKFCKNRQEVSLLEKQIVNADYIASEETYNLREGGENSSFLTDEIKKKISQRAKGRNAGEKNYFYGKRLVGQLNGNYGNKWSDEQRLALSIKKKQWMQSPAGIAFRQARSEYYKQHGGNFTGHHHTEEHKKHMSEIISKRNSTPEYKKRASERSRGGNNAMARKILCEETGQIFETCKAAAAAAGMHVVNFRKKALYNHEAINDLHYVYADRLGKLGRHKKIK